MTFRIGAYYASWATYGRNYQVTDVDASKLSHILYAFFNLQPNGAIVSGDPYADFEKHFPTDSWNDVGKNLYGNLKQLFELKKKHRHLKVSLAVGGWTWSTHFSDVAANPEARKVFVASCIQHVSNLGLDGVCVDWEYPIIPGMDGNKARPEDGINFVSLLRELREALDGYAKEKGEYPHARYLVSACLPGAKNRLKALPLQAVAEQVDELHVMSYDFEGSWSSRTGHQSNLYGGTLSTDQIMHEILSQGVPPSKLLLGLPMYGRAFCNTAGIGHSFHGVGDVNQTKGSWEAGVWDYKVLPLEGSDEHFDCKSGAAYCYEEKKKLLVSYDTPESVSQKVEYVKSKGLGGVFFWELSGDNDPHQYPHRSLLATAFRGCGERPGLDLSVNHLHFSTSVYDNVRATCAEFSTGEYPSPPSDARHQYHHLPHQNQVGHTVPTPQPPAPMVMQSAYPQQAYNPQPHDHFHQNGPPPLLPPRVSNSPSVHLSKIDDLKISSDKGHPNQMPVAPHISLDPVPPLPARSAPHTNSPYATSSYPNVLPPAFIQVPLPAHDPTRRIRRLNFTVEVEFDEHGRYTTRSLPMVEYYP